MPFGRGGNQGLGQGMGKGGRRGRFGGNRPGAGPGGDCICPQCGKKLPHQAGVPCYSINCPNCGTRMMRA